MRLILGITGASGVIYGTRLLEFLKREKVEVETYLVISEMGKQIIELELEQRLEDVIGLASFFYENTDLTAPIASGSFHIDATIIVPCSMKTVASVANGISENLIARAADIS
ncbi:MAG: UbiX family flavin prenyltransferase, partial [Candidatus Syntropharchaeales archaeon]